MIEKSFELYFSDQWFIIGYPQILGAIFFGTFWISTYRDWSVKTWKVCSKHVHLDWNLVEHPYKCCCNFYETLEIQVLFAHSLSDLACNRENRAKLLLIKFVVADDFALEMHQFVKRLTFISYKLHCSLFWPIMLHQNQNLTQYR